MATKQKNRTKHGAAVLVQQARRSFEKGDFKEALKNAKVGYRQQPDPETRRLLERAYLARGRQLHRAGMRDESRAVIESLLELGATDGSVQQELPELLVALGLFNRVAAVQGTGASLEAGSPLFVAAADQAVMQTGKTYASLPAVRQGAQTIGRALAALEAGDEAEAMAALRDIARSSPFADWKYFVRGLAAYYRQDGAEMQANWDRLDGNRFAARIAASLRVVADPNVVPIDDSRATEALTRLGSAILGGPIVAQLQKLQGHVAAGRWREAVRSLRFARPLLSQVDAALPRRLTNVLYATIVRRGNPMALGALGAVAEPLPIDPHWNRGLAMAWEHLDDDVDPEGSDPSAEAERYWRAYLDDLDGVESLLPEERPLARALVWLRLGRMLVEDSCPICATCGVRHEPDEDVQARAIVCLENSLRLSPGLLSAYRALAEAYHEWDEPDKAAATWRRVAERFPDNLESLLFLANHHYRRDEPFEAAEFAFRAQRLKPLDAQIRALVFSIHLASARHHALAARWEDGRAEFAAAEKLGCPSTPGYHVLVRRAAFELKAGESGLAHRLLDRARSELGEAAPVWLLMSIECRRYACLPVIASDFDHRWATALKKSRRSAPLGEMCRTVTAYRISDIDYSGRGDHAARLLDFLAGCMRIRKWQAADLRAAMDFLAMCGHESPRRKQTFLSRRDVGKASDLLAALATKARRQFPDDAYFQLMVGELEMQKGPLDCDHWLATECFERVLEIPPDADEPDGDQMVKRARKNLDLLSEGDESPFHRSDDDDDDDDFGGLPFVFDEGEDGLPEFPIPGLPKGMFGSFVQMCRQLGIDPEDVLRQAAAGAPFRFPPGGRSSRPKK